MSARPNQRLKLTARVDYAMNLSSARRSLSAIRYAARPVQPMSRSLAIAIFTAAAVTWLGFSIWTVRRLWRVAETPYARMVYHSGVRGFGLGFWVLFTIIFSLRTDAGSLGPIGQTLLTLFVGLPIALWGGYAWGRSMASFYGLTRGD